MVASISPSRRDSSQAVVRVGGRRVATLSVRQVRELGLAADRPVDGETLERIRAAGDVNRAVLAAVKQLVRRAMSRRRVGERLRSLGHEPAVIDEAVGRLCAIGLIDDEAMGRELIRELCGRRAAGPRLLREKLVARGIDRGLAERLVEEAAGGADEQFERALEAAGARLRSMRGADPVRQRRRLWAYLVGRGYEPEVIERVVERLVGPGADGSDDMEGAP